MCAGPDAPDCEDTGFSTQPSGDQSGKLGHTCPHMALIGLKQKIALIMDEREEGTHSSYVTQANQSKNPRRRVVPVFPTLKGVGRVTVARPPRPPPSSPPQDPACSRMSACRLIFRSESAGRAAPRVNKSSFLRGRAASGGSADVGRLGRAGAGQGGAGAVCPARGAPLLQLWIWTRGWDRDSRMVQFPPAPPYQRTTTPAMHIGRRGRQRPL